MSLWSSVVLVAAIGVAVLGLPQTSEAQLVLYDDFRSGLIDPEKWFGSVSTVGIASPTADIARLVKGGKLDLLLRQYGRDDSDAGSTAGSVILNVVNPDPITTFASSVTIKQVQLDTCASNSSGALVRTRVQVAGTFFNDGTSTGSSDRTGDIAAGIQMISAADVTVGNALEAFVYRCLNAACSTTNTFLGQVLAMTWKVGQKFLLSVTWDSANNRFTFSASKGKTPETATLSYSQSDADPAVGPARRLVVANNAANCDGSRKQAFVEAIVDNVMVNP